MTVDFFPTWIVFLLGAICGVAGVIGYATYELHRVVRRDQASARLAEIEDEEDA